MSNWEVKTAWQKGNGDWVLTVGPGVESGSVAGGTLVFCLIVLEVIKAWGAHGAMALFAGTIAGMFDIMYLTVAFYQHFWLALTWSVAAGAAWAATFTETPWLLKIPGFFALLWILNQMLTLAK